MKTLRLTALSAIWSLATAGATVAQVAPGGPGEPITVFVVRHAEKGPGNPDPDLTAAGLARATALAHVLGDAKVSSIFTSEFTRTRATAVPLAARLHLTAEMIEAGKIDELIARLKALPAGSRGLVVSHSNLVPAIVERLSGQQVGELTDADYDRLYAVTVWPNGQASVLYLHFGIPAGGAGGSMRP